MNEFDIIQHYFTNQPIHRKDVVQEIGDDAAIVSVPPDQELVITTDALVSGVHFPETTSPVDIGYKALAVNLSDLAAMGAEPAWFTLALNLPKANEQWIKAFCEGLFGIAKHYQIQLVGGNLTHGPLSITIQALGLVPKNKALLRSTAQPKDRIYVTGTLGDAALGLLHLQKKVTLNHTAQSIVLKHFNRPEPRLRCGLLLRYIAHAVIDISDGLATDLEHLLKASHVGAEVNVEHLPLSDAMKRSVSIEQALTLALTGGEDYELCFTVSPNQCDALEREMKENQCPITCIGEIKKEAGLELHFTDGRKYHGPTVGYQHFK